MNTLFGMKKALLTATLALVILLLGKNAAYAADMAGAANNEDKIYTRLENGESLDLSTLENSVDQDSSGGITSGKCGDNLKWEYNEDYYTLTITGYGDMYDYNNVDGKIKAPWDEFNLWIRKLVLPEGLTSIGKDAFHNLYFIRSVTIPSTVKKIGYAAFINASNLEAVNIPDGLTTIEGAAFLGTEVKNVTIPSSVTYMGLNCFNYALRSITFKNVKLSSDFYFYSKYLNADNVPVTMIQANTLVNETFAQGICMHGKDGLKYTGLAGDYRWTIDNNGLFKLYGTGDFERTNSYYMFHDKNNKMVEGTLINRTWDTYLDEIKAIQLTIKGAQNIVNLCEDMVNAKSVTFVDCDFSNAVATYGMFSNCKSLKKVEMTNLEFSKAVNAGRMFFGCCNLESVKLDGTHMPEVTSLSSVCGGYGYENDKMLKSFSWKDSQIEYVTKCDSFFVNCTSLEKVDISGISTSRTINFERMFCMNTNLKALNLSSMDMSKAAFVESMFEGCDSLTYLKTPMKTNTVVPHLPQTFLRTDTGEKCNSIPKNLKASIVLRTPYTITYVLDGGKNNSANPDYYLASSATITLKAAKKTGYTFVGWYNSSSFKKKVTEIKKGSKGNLKLYAKWSPNKYTIKFSPNGGKGTMKSINTKYDVKVKLTKNTFKRSGYKFLGWSTDKKAKKAEYKNAATVKNLTSKKDSTVTLYAVWKKK